MANEILSRAAVIAERPLHLLTIEQFEAEQRIAAVRLGSREFTKSS
jgi:predicted aconitase with swiveling domain